MCPNHHLLSAYYDEELDPEQEERIVEHLSSCTACRERLASFASLSDELMSLPVPDLEGSQARSWKAIQAARRVRVVTIWQRRLSVPIPVVAAAAAAIVLALGFSSYVALSGLGRGESAPMLSAALPREGAPMNIEVSNINDIINYLNSRELGANVTMQLPKSLDRMSMGQPELLRAADYKRVQ